MHSTWFLVLWLSIKTMKNKRRNLMTFWSNVGSWEFLSLSLKQSPFLIKTNSYFISITFFTLMYHLMFPWLVTILNTPFPQTQGFNIVGNLNTLCKIGLGFLYILMLKYYIFKQTCRYINCMIQHWCKWWKNVLFSLENLSLANYNIHSHCGREINKCKYAKWQVPTTSC